MTEKEHSTAQDSGTSRGWITDKVVTLHFAFHVDTSTLGYSNWKKAMYNDGGFKWHDNSEGHLNAMFAWSK